MMFKIGCHLSASGGYLKMGKEALKIGANTFQFFTRNPRGGAAKAIDEGDVKVFLDLAADNGIDVILAHAPYTMNLCSADEKIRAFAKNMLEDDLHRMEYTPGNLYNFHPGSHVSQGVERGIEFICAALNETLFDGMTTTVLLETMAGKGSEIGSKFEELREIIDRTEKSEHLGVCLDTCHVFDAGYDIKDSLETVLEEFDRVLGISRLCAVHINDSKNPFCSHKDRHEKIGMGSLGTECFERIINHPALRDLPFFLETPNDIEGYANEIKLLKELRHE